MPQPATADSFADRSLHDLGKRARLPQAAIRAVLQAQRLLGLAIGVEIAQRRNTPEALQRAVADLRLVECLLRVYQEACALLGEYIDKVHERHRPHYSPEQRFRILRVKSRLGDSQEETARIFRVATTTIGRWEQEASREPGKETVGSLIKPKPPVRRYADVVRELVQTMAASGFGGSQQIAETLARAGWKLARETVRRIRKEPPPPKKKAEVEENSSRSVRARHPHHVWMVDLTEIPGLFRLFSFKLLAVLDVYSRAPLAWKLTLWEPSARTVQRLLQRAIRQWGRPRHLVSDRGRQFTSGSLRRWLRRQGIQHRLGAVGKTGSIALIERFWRTAKQLLGLPFYKPLLPGEVSRRLEAAFFYYTHLRAHHGLAGATPQEVLTGSPLLHLQAVAPPRGRPGERAAPVPFRTAVLEAGRPLPYLIRAA